MERLPTLNRRLHDLRRIASRLKRSRMTPLQVCEATLGRPGGFLTTSAAFARLAQAASRRLVVMSPFIDAGGFRWLRRVFEATRMDCQKIVVLRNAEQYSVELGVQHADWLRALRVSVRDYHLSHDAASGRALPIETFHAKLIVADDTFAYVGSANLLNSSEGLSLETGLLVEGATAIQVARLVDAVLRVARAL
jgi:phosphatidylserine/phosphatidylglycerophosphate/cardiolipin synthase-like enzyme